MQYCVRPSAAALGQLAVDEARSPWKVGTAEPVQLRGPFLPGVVGVVCALVIAPASRFSSQRQLDMFGEGVPSRPGSFRGKHPIVKEMTLYPVTKENLVLFVIR